MDKPETGNHENKGRRQTKQNKKTSTICVGHTNNVNHLFIVILFIPFFPFKTVFVQFVVQSVVTKRVYKYQLRVHEQAVQQRTFRATSCHSS